MEHLLVVTYAIFVVIPVSKLQFYDKDEIINLNNVSVDSFPIVYCHAFLTLVLRCTKSFQVEKQLQVGFSPFFLVQRTLVIMAHWK